MALEYGGATLSSRFSLGLSRRSLLVGAAATATVTATAPAHATGLGLDPATTPDELSPRWAQEWVQTCYDLTWREGPTPPNAARCYGYLAVAMYEACVAGMPDHRSVGGQLTGLAALPPAPKGKLDWPIALAAAAHTVSRHVYAKAAAAQLATLDALLDGQVAGRREQVPSSCVVRSLEHGRRVGRALNDWIDTDGYAAIAGRPYTPPVGESLWVSTPPNFRPAIEPYWAEIRPLVMSSPGEVRPGTHLPYSTVPGSEFHQQAETVYRTGLALTDEQRAIARFWTDNPLLSGLPSGHWFLAVSQVADQRKLSLERLLEAYVRLGITLHDAFLSCWTAKYIHNLLRPVTYINRHIDPAWATFVNSPQFPEYTSGHSVASRAASAVLTDLLGTFEYVDDSHRDRGLPARSFTSFTHAADEAAQSRLYGGIHFPMGIENGKEHGDRLGAVVLQRLRTRR